MKLGIMSFAHMHAYSYGDVIRQLSGVELVGVADLDQERGKQAAISLHYVLFVLRSYSRPKSMV